MFETIKLHEDLITGITLKDEEKKESNNMALHVCQSKADIIANREQLSEKLNVPLNQFVCANQTHSDRFYKVTKEDLGRGAYHLEDAIDAVDALYTKEAGLMLTTFTADCVPLIFYDPSSQLIGAIHSGWKGTVQSITEKVFTHLKKEEGLQVDTCLVHIGSCLSMKNFEVDKDVEQLFKKLTYADDWITYDPVKNKYFIDNQAVVKEQCLNAGIQPENIDYDQVCTMDSKRHFSYRQDKKTGRHMTFIYRKT